VLRGMRFSVILALTLGGLIGLAPGPARAADAITVTLGGRIKEFFFVASQTQAPAEELNSAGMFNDTRLSVEGRTVLDNGITVRTFARFNIIGNAPTNVDEAYVDIISSFGRLRLGDKDGPNTTTIGDPVPQALLSVDEEIIADALMQRTSIVLRDAFTFRRFTRNALGVSYQTPEIAGFRVGVGYHPTPTPAVSTIDGAFLPHDAVDVTADYTGDFTGGTYRLAGGYFRMSPSRGGIRAGLDGARAWNVSAGLTYGGFELAGAYMNIQPSDGRDEQAWTVGALYGIGPFTISADHRRAKRQPFLSALLPARVFYEHAERTTLQGGYKIGPGIVVGLAGFYAEQQDALGANYDGGGVLGGIKVDF